MYTATCAVSTTEIGGSSWDTCASNNEKRQTRARMKFFFFLVGRSSQCKIAKIKLRNQFWRAFYTSVKTENRKIRGN